MFVSTGNEVTNQSLYEKFINMKFGGANVIVDTFWNNRLLEELKTYYNISNCDVIEFQLCILQNKNLSKIKLNLKLAHIHFFTNDDFIIK